MPSGLPSTKSSEGKPLRVDPQWRCQKSGECCTKLPEVVMTKEEAAFLVFVAPSTLALHFRPVGTRSHVAMKAGPCPFFAFNTCTVYEHRPYNCRRFGCMRPDLATEPFEIDGSNLHKRVSSDKGARKLALYMQRKAQVWANTHGWSREDPL